MPEIIYNADVRNFTTFGIPAKTAAVVRYDSIHELEALLRDTSLPRPLKHLGQGSNILFTEDFPGTILISRIDLQEVDIDGTSGMVTVTASAGTVMDNLCETLARQGVWGLENLSGIPGTVGASAVQNVGAYGVEAGDFIISVDTIETATGRRRSFSRDEMEFGYRHSIFKTPEMSGRYIITAVSFRLTVKPSPRLDYANLRDLVGDNPSATDMRRAVIAIRDSKLPSTATVGNAGSFFKNPVVSRECYDCIAASMPGVRVPHFIVGEDAVKIPAAWLIDKAGCKEMAVEGASLWPSQPLVIVNTRGTATSRDVTDLEHLITDAVRNRFGITLHPEVEHI